MRLFIQIRNGKPFEHPILEDNFLQAFPNVDIENLPESFANFVRVETPKIGVYDVYEGVTYEWRDGVVTDIHHVRTMTEQEILQKQEKVKYEWKETGFVSWVFDETSCSFKAPIAYPVDGKLYNWDEPTTSWVEVTRA